jgi:NAD(P)-dependent dehydrogenase (short-subunit alcohol dehydrogenase family)
VNVSSVSAHGVRTGPPAYAAAKAGVEGLSRLMAVQLGPLGIRVQHRGGRDYCHAMAAVTEVRRRDRRNRSSTLTGRIGAPEDVARTVAFLCSRRRNISPVSSSRSQAGSGCREDMERNDETLLLLCLALGAPRGQGIRWI